MADPTVGVVYNESKTTTGTQDVTIADLGTFEALSAAFIFVGSQGTEASPDFTLNARIGYGFSTGENDNAINASIGISTIHSTSGRASLAIAGLGNNTPVLFDLTVGQFGGNDTDYRAGPNDDAAFGWIEDGVKLDYHQTDGTARGQHFMLMRDVPGVRVGSILIDDNDTSKNVTTPGFRPTFVLTFSYFHQSAGVEGFADGGFGFGVAHSDSGGTIRQYSFAWQDKDQTPAVPRARIASDAMGRTYDPLYPTEIQATSFDAQGFNLDVTLNNQAFGYRDHYGYLAIQLDDHDNAYAGIYDTPTSTGETAEIVCGFSPGAVLVFQTMLTVVDSNVQSSDAGAFAIGMTDFVTEGCDNISVEDGVSSGAGRSSLSTSKLIHLYNDAGSLEIEGTIGSRSATGFTLDFTQVSSSARKFIIVAWKTADSIVTETLTTDFSAVLIREPKTTTTSLSAVISGEVPPKIKIDRYRHEPVPEDYNPWYFQSEFLKLEVITDLIIRGSIESYHVEPEKVRDGLIVIADGVDWNPGSGTGMYYYYNGGWRFLG